MANRCERTGTQLSFLLPEIANGLQTRRPLLLKFCQYLSQSEYTGRKVARREPLAENVSLGSCEPGLVPDSGVAERPRRPTWFLHAEKSVRSLPWPGVSGQNRVFI